MVLAKNAEGQAMSAAAITAGKLVLLEESSTRSRMLAYRNVASRIGRSASWLRNFISRGGSISSEIERALDALLVKHLEAQLVRLQAELDVARQIGAHPASPHLSEIESHLSKVRALLNGNMNLNVPPSATTGGARSEV